MMDVYQKIKWAGEDLIRDMKRHPSLVVKAFAEHYKSVMDVIKKIGNDAESDASLTPEDLQNITALIGRDRVLSEARMAAIDIRAQLDAMEAAIFEDKLEQVMDTAVENEKTKVEKIMTHQATPHPNCAWVEDENQVYSTSCNRQHQFTTYNFSTNGETSINHAGPIMNGFNWCPFCGEKTVEVKLQRGDG